MCNATRQPADPFGFLLFEKGISGLPLVLDIRACAQPVRNLSGAGLQWNGPHQMPSVAPVGRSPDPMFDFERGAGLPGFFPGDPSSLAVLRVEETIPP